MGDEEEIDRTQRISISVRLCQVVLLLYHSFYGRNKLDNLHRRAIHFYTVKEDEPRH